jgi:hypothetical protein
MLFKVVKACSGEEREEGIERRAEGGKLSEEFLPRNTLNTRKGASAESSLGVVFMVSVFVL